MLVDRRQRWFVQRGNQGERQQSRSGDTLSIVKEVSLPLFCFFVSRRRHWKKKRNVDRPLGRTSSQRKKKKKRNTNRIRAMLSFSLLLLLFLPRHRAWWSSEWLRKEDDDGRIDTSIAHENGGSLAMIARLFLSLSRTTWHIDELLFNSLDVHRANALGFCFSSALPTKHVVYFP